MKKAYRNILDYIAYLMPTGAALNNGDLWAGFDTVRSVGCHADDTHRTFMTQATVPTEFVSWSPIPKSAH